MVFLHGRQANKKAYTVFVIRSQLLCKTLDLLIQIVVESLSNDRQIIDKI